MNSRWIAILAALMVTASGCGDDDESGAAAGNDSGPLSKAEFVKRAGDICQEERRDVLTELGAYYKKHGGSPRQGLTARSPAEERRLAKAFKAVFLPIVEGEVAAIDELGAPNGDEAEIAAILAAEREGIREARRMKRATENIDFTQHFTEAGKLLRDYGIMRCLKG